MNEVIIRSSPNCFLHIFYAIFKNVCKNGVCCKNYNLFIHFALFCLYFLWSSAHNTHIRWGWNRDQVPVTVVTTNNCNIVYWSTSPIVVFVKVFVPTSHTELASTMPLARRRGWRPGARVWGVCSSEPWEQSGRWSWRCWATRCSCMRHWAALYCAGGWLCAPGTNVGTWARTTGAPRSTESCSGCWWRRAELRKTSWLGGPAPSMCQ